MDSISTSFPHQQFEPLQVAKPDLSRCRNLQRLNLSLTTVAIRDRQDHLLRSGNPYTSNPTSEPYVFGTGDIELEFCNLLLCFFFITLEPRVE